MMGIQLHLLMKNHIYLAVLCVSLRFMTVEGVRCDPRQHKYYHPQANECMDCEKCNPGEERIPYEVWDHRFNMTNGPTICRPCRTCGKGTFSHGRAFKCKSCSECAITEIKVSHCTSTVDTICRSKQKTEVFNTSKWTTRSSFAGEEQQEVKKDPGNDIFYIIVIPICVTIIVIFVLFFFFRQRNDRCSKHIGIHTDQVEKGSHTEQRDTINGGNALININSHNGPINYFASPLETKINMEQVNAGDTKCQDIITSYPGENENDDKSADDENSQIISFQAITTKIHNKSQMSETSEEGFESDLPSEDTNRVWKPVRKTKVQILKRQCSYPFDETIPKYEREPFLRS